MAFTNFDYNKNLKFKDENVFKKTYEDKVEEGKNIAIDAYNLKKKGFVDNAMFETRTKMKSPKYEMDLVLNKGTDAEMLNPKFYDLMNTDETDILEDIRGKAGAAGIHPMSIKPQDVVTDELTKMKNSAVTQHYQELMRYSDEYGPDKLQQLLDKEGHKFKTFYRKFTDPFIEADGTGGLYVEDKVGNKGIRFKKKFPHLAAAYDSGMRFTFDEAGNPYLKSGAFWNDVTGMFGEEFGESQIPGYKANYGAHVQQDKDGRLYYETGWNPLGSLLSNVFGSGNVDFTREYLPDEENPDVWWGSY